MEQRPSTIHSALAEFLDDLAVYRSPATISTYRRLLRLEEAPLADLDRAYLRRWMAGQVRARKPAGAATACAAIKSFASWLAERGWLAVNPGAGLPIPSVPETPAQALSIAQTTALVAACRTDRERLALALLGTGLRRAELAGLRWQDVDAVAGTMTVTGKGRRVRKVLAPTLPEHPATGSVFGMSGDGVYRMFKRVAVRAGLGWAHPHLLRHTYATRMLAAGMSPLALRTLGGWVDDAMLQRYARASVQDAALEEARRFRDTDAAP